MPKTAIRIFASCCESDRAGASESLEALRALGSELSHSPEPGPGTNWGKWYEGDCRRSMEVCDAFVAVVTQAYGCSTWMQHEADEAFRLLRAGSRPRMFIFRAIERPLPAGFRAYEKVSSDLPADPAEAAAALVRTVRRSLV